MGGWERGGETLFNTSGSLQFANLHQSQCTCIWVASCCFCMQFHLFIEGIGLLVKLVFVTSSKLNNACMIRPWP